MSADPVAELRERLARVVEEARQREFARRPPPPRHWQEAAEDRDQDDDDA